MRKKKQIEYLLIVDTYESKINKRVNEALKKGWELYGFPRHSKDDGSTIIQGLIREKVEEIPIPPKVRIGIG